MNCSQHPNRPAVYECDCCGAPICQSCYDDFDLPNDEGHLCADCYKEELRSEAAEALSLKSMVKKEFILIIVGLIVGLILGIIMCVDMGVTGIAGIAIFPFIFGSLMTIVKKIKNEYSETRNEGDDTNWISLVLIIIFNLALAPVTTIVRFVQRIGDMKKLNRIYEQDINAITTIDDYLERSLQPSAVSSAASGSGGDVEISLDAILASGAGSDSALCDNGEILRTVRTR